MSKRYVSTLSGGRLAVTTLRACSTPEEEERCLAKTIFELSRDGSDMHEHFDPSVHTLAKLAEGMPKHVSLSCRSCEDTDLPRCCDCDGVGGKCCRMSGQDRYFRAAWRDDGAEVVTDRTQAEAIKMDRIRQVRNQQLCAEDINWHKASGDDAKATVETERQRLRDIPATFDISTSAFPTIANLRQAWPDLTAEPEEH